MRLCVIVISTGNYSNVFVCIQLEICYMGEWNQETCTSEGVLDLPDLDLGRASTRGNEEPHKMGLVRGNGYCLFRSIFLFCKYINYCLLSNGLSN